MCGIVGYVGDKNASCVILDSLRRLEYRGYDSAGMAIDGADGIEIYKEVGKVADLAKLVEGKNPNAKRGIGHTRWATHGGVTLLNAHPHSDRNGQFALVHNGIIENYMDIKEQLQREGVAFKSETDTEVIVHLLSNYYDEMKDMVEAMVKLQETLSGSYALAVIRKGDDRKIYCVRRGSPLVLGLGEGETFCASDVPAFLPYTRSVVYLEEGEIAELRPDGVTVWNSKGELVSKDVHTVEWDVTMAEKAGHSHYMHKEIHEQGMVLRTTLKGRISDGRVDLSKDLNWTQEDAQRWKKVHIIACGTSYYAALVAERVFERWTDLDIRVDIASEYRYRNLRCDPETLAIFVSQSGETADTIAAQRKARAEGAHCMAITNVRGSTLAREVHSILLLKAGPEIGVAATKTFTGQVAALFLSALYLGRLRGSMTADEEARLVNEFLQIPYKVENVLEKENEVIKLAQKYHDRQDFLFIGRGISFPVALEGALKLKEISYIHAEAYAAGEMKHGPIALLDEKVPVMAIIPRDMMYEKTLSNVLEAKARKAPVIGVCTEGDEHASKYMDDYVEVPWTDEEFSPFLTVIPLQLFAFHVAKILGKEIDQPRNLAKSVTVE
ncbi:glutamine--fructose-6-phosphate transaminase [Thermovirga lienii DSM 17291]|uniref:Glutamine--fructose-6-phosphate aminotransferase [isomerizing] n=1 Tax=Thermovirga lienii (strain ATCC BAA-1197 / DSM 17291 / Cas60314) TaxID=580340 RepID=G7V9E6_THELD|nr:glutamine--fructose-6-phosphate transaminase (isomerizing) [Thermovirga lienii]AER66496.1 glutamine--fructose-6-phosphate transaminase [Thermovirga lienii DSM 17291]